MLNQWLYGPICKLCILLLCPTLLAAAPAHRPDPFCADSGCVHTRQWFKQLCDYIVKEKRDFPTIFIGGYYMRTLVDGYEIFGDRGYLDTALAYGDALLKKQMPNGFWPTGYGAVYLADTGSALGLLVALYPHADRARQKAYLNAVGRYVNSIQANGLIHSSGALGTGWRHVQDGRMSTPIPDQYTLSSALTGGEIFTWMYDRTGQDKYREVAYHALKWVLSTMRSDGNIPYILAEEGADWSKRGNPQDDYNLWAKMAYGTTAYVGEGILSFALHCNQTAWRAWIEKAVRPNIDFVLQNQLQDGTWSKLGRTSWDRTRSPGIIDYLIWYYDRADRDPRIPPAVRRFDAFILNPQNARSYGLLNEGASAVSQGQIGAFNAATSLTGRAVADILSPGVDSRW
jgi:hypothetical protein